MPLTTDERLLTLSRDVIERGFDKAGWWYSSRFQTRPCERHPADRRVYALVRGCLAYARTAYPAAFHSGDGALLGLRRNSDCSR